MRHRCSTNRYELTRDSHFWAAGASWEALNGPESKRSHGFHIRPLSAPRARSLKSDDDFSDDGKHLNVDGDAFSSLLYDYR